MVSTGGCASAGFPIASCKIYSDKSYAFLEFRSVEEASNCMAFDGVAFKDSYLRVRQIPTTCCACCSISYAASQSQSKGRACSRSRIVAQPSSLISSF